VKHAKAYNAIGKKERRFQIFKDNLRFIEEHNNEVENKKFKLGLNRFMNLTNEEYKTSFLGTEKKLRSKKSGHYTFRVEESCLPWWIEGRRVSLPRQRSRPV